MGHHLPVPRTVLEERGRKAHEFYLSLVEQVLMEDTLFSVLSGTALSPQQLAWVRSLKEFPSEFARREMFLTEARRNLLLERVNQLRRAAQLPGFPTFPC